uniref:Myb/SANT-like domain-containing protein n=1 Tax=Lactuca sativa TaxID=4236 RepID=A0A9R1UTV1_LACSA|nr:hypothetical protein LSAT_V11C800435250 [Lactuca sativa]
MWIFLVLMTIANLGGTKRVRKEPRQISVVSTGEESGSELDPKLCMIRTRKRVMTSVASIDQRRRRGPNINKKASHILDKIVENQPDARITLRKDTYTKKFVGDSAAYFATEVGIVMRKFCPMEFHTWEKVPKENKEEMIDRLRAKFEILHADIVLMECVDEQMRRQWKRTRNTLKDFWKKNGGMTDPQLARSKMKPDCRSKEDWSHLCDYWETDKAQKYADQMKNNREKLVISSRGGSRSIANHKFSMATSQLKNKETQLPPTPIELYHKLHFHPTKEWLNDETRIQYENILQMKEDECTKLVSAGISITPEMEYEIEKKAVKTVCARHKTLLSGWEASSGPIMRKKDLHILSAAEPSQSASTDEMALKNKVTALEEEVRENKEKVKQSEEKCEKMLQFMISKFPDSQNILCPPDKEGFRASDDMPNISDEELKDIVFETDVHSLKILLETNDIVSETELGEFGFMDIY